MTNALQFNSEPFFYDRVAWESDNKDMIKQLQEEFGKKPNWFGYKLMKEKQ
jgi:hypothetical protein